METKITFKDVWKAPFKYDDWSYIWDSNNVMVFTFNDYVCTKKVNGELIWDNSFCYNFVNLLNDKPGEKLSNLEIRDECDLYMNGEELGCFRGWGHLTGTGGLNLDYKEAAKVQDDFIKWCIKKLSR